VFAACAERLGDRRLLVRSHALVAR
jgi:hypothetical protein